MTVRETLPADQRPVAALPPQPISAEVLIEKYAKGDELTVQDVRLRVARALARVEAEPVRAEWEQRFFETQITDCP